MANDPNALPTDWAPGQPPPWLAAYGPVPPPLDSDLAGAPGAPMPPPAPAPIPPLQPGLGIPAAAVDAAAGAMQQPAPQPAPFDLPPMQPGMGIPADAVDNAANAIGPRTAPPAPQQPPPPWLQVVPERFKQASADTISGAGDNAPEGTAHNPIQDLARIAQDPNASASDRELSWKSLPADMRADIVNGADPEALVAITTAAMSPQERATIGLRYQTARMLKDSAQQVKLAQQAQEDAQQDFEMRKAAYQQATEDTKQLAAEAKALSQQKIDPKEHGVGNFIASVLAGAIGGAVSQYTGGRNLALEELDKRTQTRIDAQKANLENRRQGLNFKRNLIAEQLQRSDDLYRAQVAYHLQTNERAKSELLTVQQNYIAQGTTSLRIADAVAQLDAGQRKMLDDYAQQKFKNELEAAKVGLDARKAAQEAIDKKAQRDIEEANSKRSAWVATRGQDIGLQEKLLEESGKGTERAAAKQDKLTEQDRELGVTAPGVGALKQADGSVFKMPTREEGTSSRKMLAAAADYNKLTNDLIRGIAEHGGESSYLKSDEFQATITKQHELAATLHEAYGVEGFRENTIEFFEKMATAGVDPTSFVYNATAALRTSNADLQGKLNNRLAASGYTGKPVKFEDLSTITPTANVFSERTVLENAEGKGPAKPGGTIDKVAGVADKVLYPFGHGDKSSDAVSNTENADPEDAGATGLTKGQQAKINDLVVQYKKGGKEGEAAAAAVLDYVAENRPSLRAGILTTLRGDAPQLWQQALGKLPPDERAQQEANAAAAISRSPTAIVASAAANGDSAATQELIARATAGDKAAVAALHTIVTGKAEPAPAPAPASPKSTSTPVQMKVGPGAPAKSMSEANERTARGGR